jgi:hypothetical protein
MRRPYVIFVLSALVLVACSGPPDSGLSAMSGPTGRISSVTPSEGETDVAVDTEVRVTFSGEVQSDSPEDMLVLEGSDGTLVPGEVSLSEDRRTVILVPHEFLDYGTEYTATVDASELSRGRGRPPQDFTYTWSFTTRPNPIVTIEIQSHQDGQQVFGPRTITLAGSLSSSVPITEVEVRHNGGALTDVLWDQTAFSAVVELNDNDDNLLEVLARNEAGLEGTADVSLSYPYFRLETGQTAAVYIGKYNDTGNYFLSGYQADRVSRPLLGNPDTYGGALYLPDMWNNRVLAFDNTPAVDEESADFAIGQEDFSAPATSGNGADGLYLTGSASIADGRLAVADRGNNRVLIWNQVPLSNQPADVVVGQADFGMSSAACGSSGLASPSSVHLVAGRMIVVDSGNNRVLVWNSVPTSHGTPADLVIGQSGMDTCSANGGRDYPGADAFWEPMDAWSDGDRLIVADSGNNRVLVWEAFPAGGLVAADVVVGQSSFDMSYSGGGATGLDYPTYLTSNGNQLFVSDTYNNRVLVWDVVPTENEASADFVLGQGDFDCTIENSTSVQYGYCERTSRREDIEKWMLWEPAGLHLYDGRLLVADGGNPRYLVFEAQPQP